MFELKIFPAFDGDSFLISYGKEEIKNVLIDGGRKRLVVKFLIEEIKEILSKNQVIDLMVLTHIDNDHIYGLLKLLEEDWIDGSVIKEVWFNSKEIIGKELFEEMVEDDTIVIDDYYENNDISFKQGIRLADLLRNKGIKIKGLIVAGASYQLGEAVFKIVSPNKENLYKLYEKWDLEFKTEHTSGQNISVGDKNDYSGNIEVLYNNPYQEDTAIVNGSSIAFVIEYCGKKVLMLADSHPSVVMRNLKFFYNEQFPMYMDIIKISHHASKRNINKEFVENVLSNKYIVSTNGSTHGLPNKETLVKISKSNFNDKIFYFNYPDISERLFTKEECKELNILCENADRNKVMRVKLWNSSEG